MSSIFSNIYCKNGLPFKRSLSYSVKNIGKSFKDLGKISKYSAKKETSFYLSCKRYVPKKECLGEINLCLRPFSYISFPIGDLKAISSVIIRGKGTNNTVSPFFMFYLAWTPL